ncbi:hypothetical protein [Nonomuraea rubra]|uniref:hypothetical protein n=1 Tax=Nonomuraea rubra TaxID=46180 RepID=UPI0033FAE19A
MLIAVAVLAAAVVGAVAWWLRRNGASGGDPVGGEGPGMPGAGPGRGWELPLTSEAQAAFMEGLRAYHEGGGALRVSAEQGVLTTYEPPRLISLHLLADAFAARGDAALHDPQGTVETLLERLAAEERPGVLHLRPGWLEGEVDGLDAVRFAAAVGEAVRPGGWTAEAGVGALQVTVPDDESGEAPDEERGEERGENAPVSGDRTLTHVNGTPIKPLAAKGAVTEKEKTGDAGGSSRDASGTGDSRSGGSGAEVSGVGGSGVGGSGAAPRAGAGEANTMMLDLARVLDLYRETRAQRPDAGMETLLREVVPRLIAGGGPGVTWSRPPRPGELRTVLGSSPELR